MKGLQNAVVVTSDAKSYSITNTYLDEVSDLALIKINAKALKPAKFAQAAASIQVGDKVIAIGTPISFSLRNSATVGVVSGLNRSVDAAYRLIQSDTAINQRQQRRSARQHERRGAGREQSEICRSRRREYGIFYPV